MSYYLGLGLGVGLMLFMLVLAVAIYVVNALATMKALKALGYDKSWMAWIPFANYYALADVICKDKDSIRIVNSFDVPANLFKFWWVLLFVAAFIPKIGGLLSETVLVLFLGTNFIKIFALYDRKSESEEQVLGYISGAFPIVAAIKFLVTNPAYIEK